MLTKLMVEQAREIAELAKVARKARDKFLGNVPEKAIGEPPPARGEHNPTAALGYDPLPRDALPLRDLCNVVNSLEPAARAELFALMQIGQSDLALGDWQRLLDESAMLDDETITAALCENPDLQVNLIKGLYELKML
jgi:hypothetical protein